MHPATGRVALKEWVVTVKALDEGQQILLLRKGGIREEGKEFSVLCPQFFLYPTYEHQKAELLKEGFHLNLQQTLEEDDTPGLVTLGHWAEVTEVLEVGEQEKVDALSPYYIWTTDYAQKRLHWKPREPLTVMLIRVFRLLQPQALPILDEYAGCESWLELAGEIPLGSVSPVLPDREYQRQVEAIRQALGAAPTGA